jgi:hypothetical protein
LGDRSEGFASLALGYRNAAPLGLSLVVHQFERIPEIIFRNGSITVMERRNRHFRKSTSRTSFQ